MRRKKVNKFSKKTLILVAAGIVGFAALLYTAFFNNSSNLPTTITTSDGKKVDLKPATTEEKQQADSRKDEIIKRDEQVKTSPASSQIKKVTIVITEASANGLRAYASGVFEEGGTCTAIATNGSSQTITKTSTGFQNVSYTQCAPINWNLAGGTWTITVSYKSASSEGSQSKTVEIN